MEGSITASRPREARLKTRSIERIVSRVCRCRDPCMYARLSRPLESLMSPHFSSCTIKRQSLAQCVSSCGPALKSLASGSSVGLALCKVCYIDCPFLSVCLFSIGTPESSVTPQRKVARALLMENPAAKLAWLGVVIFKPRRHDRPNSYQSVNQCFIAMLALSYQIGRCLVCSVESMEGGAAIVNVNS